MVATLQGASPGQRSSLGSTAGLSGPEAQHPSHALLDQHNFTQIKYTAYRDKSLAERKELGVGNSDEMNTLFRFWCGSHRLRVCMIAVHSRVALECGLSQVFSRCHCDPTAWSLARRCDGCAYRSELHVLHDLICPQVILLARVLQRLDVPGLPPSRTGGQRGRLSGVHFSAGRMLQDSINCDFGSARVRATLKALHRNICTIAGKADSYSLLASWCCLGDLSVTNASADI